jgi:Leucine-rich repeat (LRR) protein
MTYEELIQLIEQIAKDERPMLDLSHKERTALPPEIGQLTKLKRLDLRDNLLPIPPEILEKTNEPAIIITYYLQHRTS